MKPAATIRAKLIAQLRTTGSMSAAPRSATALDRVAVNTPAARLAARLMKSARTSGGARLLASTINQPVLP